MQIMLKILIKNLKKMILFVFLIILFGTISYTIFTACNIYKTGFSEEKTDIKYYNSAIANCRDKEGIKQFPQKIPDSADINFYSYSSGLGGQTIILSYKADKQFIKSEISKPIYEKLSAKDVSFIFSHARGNKHKISPNSYTYFYSIKRDLANKERNFLTGFGGIATDKDLTHIMYYHINPEG